MHRDHMEGLAKDSVNYWQRTEGRKGSSVPSAQTWPRSYNEERPKRRKVEKGKEPRQPNALPPSGRKESGSMPTTHARPLGHAPKWCGHTYSFSEEVGRFPSTLRHVSKLCLGRDALLPLREAPENSPSKVRLTWTGPKGVLKRAPRGMTDTALSIWSMMDTKRVSSLIWTWGDRRCKTSCQGAGAHSPVVQGPSA